MTKSEQFLILHKVRGKPEFDVACRLEEIDGWIIPTSGHRCYPYWTKPLDELKLSDLPTVPEQWPDHYECKGTTIQPKIDISSMLSRLVPKIRRRI